MTHSGHGSRVCEFGVVHGRCRCPSTSIIKIKCPTPEVCKVEGDHYFPKHKKDE